VPVQQEQPAEIELILEGQMRQFDPLAAVLIRLNPISGAIGNFMPRRSCSIQRSRHFPERRAAPESGSPSAFIPPGALQCSRAVQRP